MRPQTPTPAGSYDLATSSLSQPVVHWDPSQLQAMTTALQRRHLLAFRLDGRARAVYLPECSAFHLYDPIAHRAPVFARIRVQDDSQVGASFAVPFGAAQPSASAGAGLQQGTQLEYDIWSQLTWRGPQDVRALDLVEHRSGACKGASHFVAEADAGRYEFRAAAAGTLGGGAGLGPATLGASASSHEHHLQQGGANPCSEARGDCIILRLQFRPISPQTVAVWLRINSPSTVHFSGPAQQVSPDTVVITHAISDRSPIRVFNRNGSKSEQIAQIWPSDLRSAKGPFVLRTKHDLTSPVEVALLRWEPR